MARPDTSWLKEGAAVVLFTPSNFTGRGGSITARTVSRLTQRDVVLDDGTRLRRDRMAIQRGTWDPDTRLLPPDHPDVMNARARNRWANAHHAVSLAADALLKATSGGPCDASAEVTRLRRELDVFAALTPSMPSTPTPPPTGEQ